MPLEIDIKKPTPAEVCEMLEIMLAHSDDERYESNKTFSDFVYRMVHVSRDTRCSHLDWITEFRTVQAYWLEVNRAKSI